MKSISMYRELYALHMQAAAARARKHRSDRDRYVCVLSAASSEGEISVTVAVLVDEAATVCAAVGSTNGIHNCERKHSYKHQDKRM